MFLKEYILIVLILTACGITGGFFLIPFRQKLIYPIFAAPLVGLLIWMLGISALYSFLSLQFGTAALLIFIGGGILTAASLIYLRPTLNVKNLQSLVLMGFVLIVIAFITFVIQITSIDLGDTGFLFMDGSDQLGYAQIADWLREHLVNQMPISSPNVPYQAFSAILYAHDPRVGSFFIISLVSGLLKLSAMFTFDKACAVALIAGYLGIAAVFARSPQTFILLLLGLLVSSWFEYSRSGYFGKILGFPTAIFILGLFLTAYEPLNKAKLMAYVLLTCAVSMMYPGTITAFMIVFWGGFFILMTFLGNYLNPNNLNHGISLQDGILMILLIVIVALATTGALSRPGFILTQYPRVYIPWYQLLPAFIDIQSLLHDGIFPLFNNDVFPWKLSWFTLFMIGISLMIAILMRHKIAISLMGGSLLLLFLLFIAHAQPSAYQLIGIFYPISLCGLIYLVDDVSQQTHQKARFGLLILLILLILNIGARVPRYLEALHRYAGPGILHTLQYSKKELDGLANTIGKNTVTVNFPAGAINYALPLLVEFGRRHIDLQWTPETWKLILGYTDWPPPKLKSTHFMLVLNKQAAHSLNLRLISPTGCSIKYSTRQYQLLSCNKKTL